MEKITMKNIFLKSMIVLISALFLTIGLSPAIANTNEPNDDIILKYSVLDAQSSTYMEEFSISQSEFIDLKYKISNIIEEVQLLDNDEEVINLLKSYLDINDYPILSRILSKLFNIDFIGRRKLVISQGLGPNFNPFKDSKTAIIKPFTSWIYTDANNFLQIPSGTGVFSLTPFRIKTLIGPQFGFMLRFRGIYVNIGQPESLQSYTFFIGSARYLGGFEFTPLSSIF
jgi:hypothetical protein